MDGQDKNLAQIQQYFGFMHPELALLTHSLMIKAIATILIAGIGGLLLREFFLWFERRLTRRD